MQAIVDFPHFLSALASNNQLIIKLVTAAGAAVHLVYQARPSQKVREDLADVVSMHEMLTNQILLFHFETVIATPWLSM